MLFKEALKAGFFELQAVRDKYRELSLLSGMHRELIDRFLEVQALLLAPICPHTESIVHATWPVAGPVDDILVKSSCYLMEAAHSFRIQLKYHTQPKKPGKGDASGVSKPTHADIWIAKTYPPWQSTVLTTLSQLYQENGTLPDNKVISSELAGKPELKKYMKRVMPFVQATREKVEQVGLEALNLTLDFDEYNVVAENLVYLENTLDVEDITIQFATEGPEKTREECCPGRPLISFSVRPSVKLRLTNPQPQNGLFSHILSVGEGDTVAKLAARLARENKLINDANSIELWRYKDVKLGPRQFPVYGKPTSGAVLIEKEAVFHANVDNNSLDISLNGSKHPVGPTVIYIVK
uniref:Uncharacterized protein n=1 Tax=Timema cristinae TaxID=61476 RepID=A0A7R9CAJ2_TIMCR|nr:unnamed protein product [Timema cristinae]